MKFMNIPIKHKGPGEKIEIFAYKTYLFHDNYCDNSGLQAC